MTYPLSPSLIKTVPDGDTHERSVCEHCGFVNYQNPKIVVGSVVRHNGKILLCRRAIEPRRGYWTIPAGYMELLETPEDGARREAREEANADRAAKQMRSAGLIPTVKEQELSGKPFWRVVVGPATSASEQASLLSTIKDEGFSDAYAVTN